MKPDKTFTVASQRGLACMYARRALPTLWRTVFTQLMLQEPEKYSDLVQYWASASTALINLRVNTETFEQSIRRFRLYLRQE